MVESRSRLRATCVVAAVLATLGRLPAQADEEPLPLYNLRPYLQQLTSSSVLILVESKESAIGRLDYGPTEDLGTTLREESPRNDHVFQLEGLEPGTRYYYRVRLEGDTSYPRASFRTLEGPGGEVVLAVIGDSGSLSDQQLAVAAELEALAPDLLLHTGDMAYPYGAPSHYYKKFFKVYERFLGSTCIYPVLGNHDCQVDTRYWLHAFDLPANNPQREETYYSYDAGDAHFTAVNSCDEELAAAQLEWLREDLANTQQRWKIVYFHHPPYSNGPHNGVDTIEAQVVSVLEEHHVDLVLNGHEHVYERTHPVLQGRIVDAFESPRYVSPRGPIYLVTGGGGASLYPFLPSPQIHLNAVFDSIHHYVKIRIRPGSLEVEAIGLDEVLVDRFSIEKEGIPPALNFLRGDTNEDGTVNLTDSVALLGFLFAGEPPPCLAASDVNATRSLDISDAVHLLNHLFQGGPPPAEPFPVCGLDPAANTDGCRAPCAAP